MRLTIADVFARLVAEELTPREAIERARAALQGVVDTSPPWFARVIAGFGAWIATGFLVGFLFEVDIVNEDLSALIVGAILLAAAVFLRRRADADEEFKRQLALSLSLAGQVLVVVGVVDQTDSGTVVGLVALAMSVVLIPLVPDQAHRFMSAVIGSIGAIAAVADLRLAWVLGDAGPWGTLVIRGTDFAVLAVVAVAAYAWRGGIRARPPELAEMLEPVAYGTIAAVFAVLLLSSFFAIGDELVGGSGSTRLNAWYVGPATTFGVTVAIVALQRMVFAEQSVKPNREAVIATTVGTILLAALTLSTPGLIAAVALLTLGFDRRNRILIGLAVVFLVKFSSVYYYSLRMTLLEKSIVLVASGLLLLAARAYIKLRFEPRAADA
jgi:uncharacterized membrane protein